MQRGDEEMKPFFKYLYDCRYVWLWGLISGGIFAGVFALYGIRMEAVWYPLLLSALFGLLFLGLFPEEIKTDYSAQGQAILMATYRQYVDPKYSLRQVLVEHQHFNDEEKREHLRRLLLRAKEQNAIPIINYNDAVSTEEIRRFEIQSLKNSRKKVVECVDNDETAAQIACLVRAETLLILTSTEGIYKDSKDPSTLITEIGGKDVYEVLDNITECEKYCSGASREGANGAKAKLEYIKDAVKQGTKVLIASAKYSIKDILSGKARCTAIGVR